MKYDLKIIFMITALIVITFVDGLLLLKIYQGNNQSPMADSKQTPFDVKSGMALINKAIGILGKKENFKIKTLAPDVTKSSPGTPSAAIGSLKYSAQILNATGKAGIASEYSKRIFNTGLFNNLSTGNTTATSSSELKIKPILTPNQEAIIASLEDSINNIPVSFISASESADLILIIGADAK